MSRLDTTSDTAAQAPPIILKLSPAEPQVPDCALTGRDDGVVIFTGTRRLGATIRQRNGLWAAWSPKQKIGEFQDPIAAERAVWAEARKRGPRP